jgi:hypothetical protein
MLLYKSDKACHRSLQSLHLKPIYKLDYRFCAKSAHRRLNGKIILTQFGESAELRCLLNLLYLIKQSLIASVAQRLGELVCEKDESAVEGNLRTVPSMSTYVN